MNPVTLEIKQQLAPPARRRLDEPGHWIVILDARLTPERLERLPYGPELLQRRRALGVKEPSCTPLVLDPPIGAVVHLPDGKLLR